MTIFNLFEQDANLLSKKDKFKLLSSVVLLSNDYPYKQSRPAPLGKIHHLMRKMVSDDLRSNIYCIQINDHHYEIVFQHFTENKIVGFQFRVSSTNIDISYFNEKFHPTLGDPTGFKAMGFKEFSWYYRNQVSQIKNQLSKKELKNKVNSL